MSHVPMCQMCGVYEVGTWFGSTEVCSEVCHQELVESQQAADEAFFEEPEDNMTDAQADADTLASCGWGTDEDYGYYGGDDGW